MKKYNPSNPLATENRPKIKLKYHPNSRGRDSHPATQKQKKLLQITQSLLLAPKNHHTKNQIDLHSAKFVHLPGNKRIFNKNAPCVK
jgi:hypothetical protein